VTSGAAGGPRPGATGGSPGRAGGTGGGAGGGPRGPAPWWSDALSDPWRNPAAHAVVVSRTAPAAAPADPSPELDRDSGAGARLRLVVMVAVVAGLLAGALGGAIGFLAATKNQSPGVVLGAEPPADPPAQQRPPDSVPAVVERVMPSVVTVQGVGRQSDSLGSGFVLTADGYILTNEHVLAEVPDNAIRVTLSDTTSLPARVVGRDRESDLAVLKVERDDLSPVELADSDGVAVGDSVLAIGAPLALPGTVTFGIVSALDRTIETRDVGGAQRYYAAIQTDAAINKGNSGGPLFDLSGRVIGVNSVIKSLVEDDQESGNIGIAFAIPINQAQRVASEIIDTGRARRTVIGAQFDPNRGGGGVRLTTVDAGGPAAAGGLRTGDIVLRLGMHSIDEPHDLIALVRRYDPGTVVTVVYRRGTATATARVTLVADAN
jgi:putative serine protease PepD